MDLISIITTLLIIISIIQHIRIDKLEKRVNELEK
jgi:hypothetical protein